MDQRIIKYLSEHFERPGVTTNPQDNIEYGYGTLGKQIYLISFHSEEGYKVTRSDSESLGRCLDAEQTLQLLTSIARM